LKAANKTQERRVVFCIIRFNMPIELGYTKENVNLNLLFNNAIENN